ncbi:MAG: hypothetical protein SNG47_07725, partial [Rikenellaceae bacterium]
PYLYSLSKPSLPVIAGLTRNLNTTDIQIIRDCGSEAAMTQARVKSAIVSEFWLYEPTPQWAVLCQNSLFVSGANGRGLPPAGGDGTPAGAFLSLSCREKNRTCGGAIPVRRRQFPPSRRQLPPRKKNYISSPSISPSMRSS